MMGKRRLLLVFVIIAVIAIMIIFLIPRAAGWNAIHWRAGVVEKSVAHFERNLEEFVRQVQESSGAYVENAGTPIFDNRVVQTMPPRVEPADESHVLGTTTAVGGAEKWIEVDLSDQRLTTWEGTKQLKDYAVSTGLPGTPTVKGEFWVWRKVLSQAYRGGSRLNGTYYYLPNVPYSLFFHRGYAIHGAYWHNDFGIRPRSHGCVNMRNSDAKEVYEWATPSMPAGFTAFNSEASNPGTRIVIHD
jgi:lipoprotein-anchoring transpeptidase ErfK/SrfK